MNVYVLKLAHRCFYVGKTKRPITDRIVEHLQTRGSAWTRLHPPIEVVETIKDKGYEELSTTLRYMSKHGVDKVRGADYVLPTLTKPQLEEIQRHLLFEKGGCFKCGKFGHFAKDCKVKTTTTSLWAAILAWFWCTTGEPADDSTGESEVTEDDTVITFGKYCGETYRHVFDTNPSYCDWIASQPNPKGDFKRFQDWCKKTN